MCVRGHGSTKDADVRPGMHRVWSGAAGETGCLVAIARDHVQQDGPLTI